MGIEGACRHLIKGRMEITGARWSLEGGEAVLRLRSLKVSRDWNDYWLFHLHPELQRHHLPLYQGGIPFLKSVSLARCSTPPPIDWLFDFIFLKEPHPNLFLSLRKS